MSLLIFSYQKQRIIAQKSVINYKLMSLRNKLYDLERYSASIADGKISTSDLMDAPASMFARMSVFAKYANATADIGAARNIKTWEKLGGLNILYNQQCQGQQYGSQEEIAMKTQLAGLVYNKMREEQFTKVAEQEKKYLDAQDRKIQQEIAQMETQLKLLDSEEEKVTKAEDDAAKKSAPNYVA